MSHWANGSESKNDYEIDYISSSSTYVSPMEHARMCVSPLKSKWNIKCMHTKRPTPNKRIQIFRAEKNRKQQQQQQSNNEKKQQIKSITIEGKTKLDHKSS